MVFRMNAKSSYQREKEEPEQFLRIVMIVTRAKLKSAVSELDLANNHTALGELQSNWVCNKSQLS